MTSLGWMVEREVVFRSNGRRRSARRKVPRALTWILLSSPDVYVSTFLPIRRRWSEIDESQLRHFQSECLVYPVPFRLIISWAQQGVTSLSKSLYIFKICEIQFPALNDTSRDVSGFIDTPHCSFPLLGISTCENQFLGIHSR